MSENMTVCPDCGAAFDTIEQAQSLPIQALQQSCPDCEYDVSVAIINYTSSNYEVVAPALRGDTCTTTVPVDGRLHTEQCGSDAMIRQQRVGHGIEARCADHMGAHHEDALSLRSEL